MLERELEKILVSEIKRMGGVAYKFVSPGNDGVPDRILILPQGRVIFTELKTDRGKTTPLQDAQIARLHRLGHDVRVLKGLWGMAEFFDELGQAEAAARIRRRML